MSDDPATVEVPVETVTDLLEHGLNNSNIAELRALLPKPKPKPRLVAVTFEQWRDVGTDYWYNDQPDLLGTLYTVLSEGIENEVINVGQAVRLKAAIRIALGVDQ